MVLHRDERHAAARWVRWTLAAVAAVLIVAVFIPALEMNRWWVRIFSFPQAQFAALLLLSAIAVPFAFSMSRTGPRVLLAAIVLTLVYQATYLLPFTPLWASNAREVEGCTAEKRLRVLVLNVREGNEQAEPVLRLVRQVEPDVFLALETDRYWTRNLLPLKEQLPHVVTASRDTPWGLTLFSSVPLVSPEVRYLVEDYVPSIKTGVRLRSGDLVDFYGMHPKPPLMHSSRRGETEIIRAAREIRSSGRPAVLAGDLNDVPWSYAQEDFRSVSGMTDPRLGRAFEATFKADNPLMRWPLDYVYFSQHFGLARFETMRDVGADHFPLLAELCYDNRHPN